MLSIAARGMELRSTNVCAPLPVPRGYGATRRPSINVSVLLASKPRREMDEAPGVRPTPLFELGTPLGPATVVFLINSSAVRSPDFSIKSRVMVRTGFGPTSSAVGIIEPVTITRSTSASAAGVGDVSCANAAEAMSNEIARNPAGENRGNDCLLTYFPVKLFAV